MLDKKELTNHKTNNKDNSNNDKDCNCTTNQIRNLLFYNLSIIAINMIILFH